MKKILLLFILFFGFGSSAQITTIFQQCNNTNAIAIHNGTLYVGCSSGDIYRFPLNNPNPTPELFKTGLPALQDFCVVGDYLFIAQRAIPSDLRRVVKLNLNVTNPAIEIVHLFSNPYGLTKDNNYLYINDTENIYRYNLNTANPTPEVIISNTGHNIGGSGMVVVNNHLYVTSTNQLKKYNLDTMAQSIVFSSSLNLKGICIGENEQIIYSVNFTDDYVYKHDLLNNTNTQFIYTQLFSPGEVIFDNNYLYVSNLEGGQVNRITMPSLEVSNPLLENSIIYPNPSSGNFTIQVQDVSLQGGQMVIFDELGKVIHKEIINSEEIDLRLQGVASGIYLLRLTNKDKEFVKKIVIQ
jgi:hypothetical protein